MKIHLSPIGRGAILNPKYNEEEVAKSVDYALVLDKIVKAKKSKKNFISIKVKREKAYVIRNLLEKEGFNVEIEEVF
jgi:hypothetical protein